MKRKQFLQSLAALPLTGIAMKLNALHSFTGNLGNTVTMPALFLGHGSPMNAIEQNEFTRGWEDAGKNLPKPNAVLCISAHWETNGTYVTAMEKPKTIHDFGGFPQQLFDVQYPAPGSPALATETKNAITKTTVGLDDQWGLDHGCWSVLKHLYPDADVPVLQLSLDYKQPPQYHFELAKELALLRKKGVLILGSGNMVHNLGMVAWDKLKEPGFAYEWATEASEKMKQYILTGDNTQLINYKNLGRAFQLAIPTPEHYLPLLYILALKSDHEKATIFNDKAIGGSFTMTSVKIDAA